MFSTITSLFMTSLMEGDFTADISEPDVSSEQASVSEGLAREDAGRAASELLEADNIQSEEMLKTKITYLIYSLICTAFLRTEVNLH
jgi:hypothetical protein